MFIEKPVTKKSTLKRKPLYGVGINDADYVISMRDISGKLIICRYYRVWANMMERAYCEKFKSKKPTYKECYVCDEWFYFLRFKLWMKKQDYKGKELDKDILIQGNKVYSPDTCIFVHKSINLLISFKGKSKKSLKTGVSLHKTNGKFYAQCRDGDKFKSIVYYDTELEASDAYKEYKYSVIKKVANKQKEPLRTALLNFKIND